MRSGGASILLPMTGAGMTVGTLLVQGYSMYTVIAAALGACAIVTFFRLFNRKKK